MIRGYPRHASVLPGDTLVLHVSTDARQFRVALYRWADGFVFMLATGWQRGSHAPDGRPDADWQWPAYRFSIPAQWPSGVYIAHLQEAEDSEPRLALDHAAVLFVVRGTGQARILYKIPLATYHAYNVTGGGCFYAKAPRSNDPPGARLTLRRPGGGIGGETFGAVDHYEPGSLRQTFAHWDARFIRWLARAGYEADFCTDFDLQDDPDLCRRYRLLLSVGHDEYWSEAMRDAVEAFIAQGGNVAFFAANVCWWRIHLVDGGTAMVCHQGGPSGALDHWRPPTGAQRPEDALTGVSYRHGGGWWDGPRTTTGYVVQDGAHWVFAGTGLRTGSRLGHDTAPPLVGYECDGAPFDRIDEASGLATLTATAAATGTPAGFAPLAVGVLGSDWQELPHREHHRAGSGIHSATMGLHSRNGTVFTAGTTDWALVLEHDVQVERITRNVIERLSARR